MYVIYQINGGIGKSVAATAVIEAISKKYKNQKLVVVSAYEEVFINNPFVFKCVNFNTLKYFYKDYIEGQDSEILVQDPYLTTEFVYEKKHLIEIWCDMNNIKYKKEQPAIYLTDREKTYYQKQYQSLDKPIMIIHTNGGAQNQPWKYGWARDIPNGTAQKVVDAFAKEYIILHVRREDQPVLNNTISLDKVGFREMACIMLLSKKRLFIDSFTNHTAAALNLPSTVCWIGTSPKVFGYDLHDNVIANKPTAEPDLKFSFLSKFNLNGEILEFPYQNENEVFDAEKIIASLKKDSKP